MTALETAVCDSGRWRKWLLAGEEGWASLSAERRAWLTQTGARYIWTHPAVVLARQALYRNLSPIIQCLTRLWWTASHRRWRSMW